MRWRWVSGGRGGREKGEIEGGGEGRTLEMKMKGSNIWPEETAARQSVNTGTGGLLFPLFSFLPSLI